MSAPCVSGHETAGLTIRRMHSPLWPLLRSYSWQELRQHPWRNAAAVIAVALGVALALAVHLINASALDEFASAARAVGGQPDLELRPAAQDTASLPEGVLGALSRHPDVAAASPVLEINTYAVVAGTLGDQAAADDAAKKASSTKVPLRVLGVDTLTVAALAPQWLPRPAAGEGRLVTLEPGTVFLNAAAQSRLIQGSPANERSRLSGPESDAGSPIGMERSNPQNPTSVMVQQGLQLLKIRVAGSVAAPGSPLAVMDIAAAQDLFGKPGVVSRIALRLRTGVDRDAFAAQWQASADAPPASRLAKPEEAADRMGALSRAYRVNLTVLALVALFTGGFLVFSVLALSVSRRAPQWALLGVLGLTARQRLQLVLLEASVLGLAGSAMGLALGTGLAALALQVLGGDLGGGYFAGSAPALHWSAGAALVFGGLGVAAALVGAWQPARWAQGLSAAQALKGLGGLGAHSAPAARALALLIAGGALALVPPLWGVPLAAYASVAALLMGGIAGLPWLVGVVLDRLAPLVQRNALLLLAVERARRVRASAAVAVSGVVASLSLAVALTVMVASFRGSVMQWLDQVLPADLYVRTASNMAAQDAAYFEPGFVRAAAALAGVSRLVTQRSQSLSINPALPAVTLIARPLAGLPLVGEAMPVPPGQVGIYVSEAMLDLYGVKQGQGFTAFSEAFRPAGHIALALPATFFIAGVWRDYARQFGTIAMDNADFERLTGDHRVNDLALWLQDTTNPAATQQALRALADQQTATADGQAQAGTLLEFASAQSIRATSLRIFDRSFAVTYWLQAIAIGIGLFGVAASFSAQVLARRKEFGLLVHLGLTRAQVLRVVALEGAAWTTLGALAGLALGMAVAVVLVKVVNPQSFHWTMELRLPGLRLAALGVAVVLAGTVTAWVSARAAAGRDAVLAVKEDW